MYIQITMDVLYSRGTLWWSQINRILNNMLTQLTFNLVLDEKLHMDVVVSDNNTHIDSSASVVYYH